jgi:uncharacterized protein (TIGR00299 family) protein
MKKIAYLDCFSGISGDMLLGSLLDAGLLFKDLQAALKSLSLTGFKIEARREARNNITGTRLRVSLDQGKQPSRDFKSIREMIQRGELSDSVKSKSLLAFDLLAEAEGKIHACPKEDVHFHEVGAVDSIIDVVGAVYGMEQLEIETLTVSQLPLGSGFADSSHGRIPIPSPATVSILKGVPVFDSGVKCEMVTPTGAALVKALADSFGNIPPMVVKKTGYGVGTRELADRPNLLRIIIGEHELEDRTETIALLETNLDNMLPEGLGYLMERLLDAGALDVIFIPVHMKKNRPGVQIQVMARPEDRDLLMEIIFKESSTLGVRFFYNQRKVLKRSFREEDSPWGRLQIKEVINNDGTLTLAPEYEACRKIARINNIPLKKVYDWVLSLNPTSLT